MTSDGPGDGPPASSLALNTREDGPYVLRTLLDEVPLSADGSQDDIKINCVDYLGGRLCYPFLSHRVANSIIHRLELVRRHIGLGTTSLRPDSSRPQRQVRTTRIHPSLPIMPPICGNSRHTSLATRCSADLVVAARRQGMHPMQLDRHLLLPPRVEPRFWIDVG